jgi:ATP-binding cassette subfamily F protein uup
MATPPLLLLSDIALTFGGAPLLDGVSLSVAAGERLALVGRNGSGKSTLLKIAAGLIEPDRGTRFVQPGATLRYLAQEPDFSGFATTLAFVEAGLGPGDDPFRARFVLEQLGLGGDEDPQHLSGGEARRAALARVLAPDPDILLLDEPTNHLDLPTIEWLEQDLAGRRAALVLISHDRRLLGDLTRATAWLDRGQARRLDRGFTEFEAWRDAVLEQEEIDRHKLDRKIVAEQDWLRYGVTARRKRNVRRLGALVAMREARRTERRAAGQARMAAAEGGLSGKLVIEAEGIAKAYGGTPVVRDFSIRVQRGDRLGIVGPNGAGKTTLVGLLTGGLAADAGTVRLGANLEVAVLEQNRDSLDPEWTVAEALTGGRGDSVVALGKVRHVVSYMADFLFRPEQAKTPLRVLSGGERARLMLARALAKPSNLLVLDEPTNDLDLDTLDVLEEMLGDYAGTVILISHDRDFLDRIVGSVLVPEGDGRWTEYAGGYADMLAQRGADLAARTVRPAPREAERTERAPPPTRPAKRRLGFHEKHALETLPATIAGLEAEVARLRGLLADPGLYARDRAAFDAASLALTSAEAALADAEHRWLELEILREDLAR